jgi:hypothetical protein
VRSGGYVPPSQRNLQFAAISCEALENSVSLPVSHHSSADHSGSNRKSKNFSKNAVPALTAADTAADWRKKDQNDSGGQKTI